MKIGVIGLGNMGLPIALRLLEKSGGAVYGNDVVRAAMDRFAEAGGTAVADPAELLRVCDAVFLSLPSNELVREKLEQAVRCCKRGALVVDTSSSVPEVMRACAAAAAEREIDLIDAPVSGGVAGPRQGPLSVLCGGESAAAERAMPLLDTSASTVTHMGALGSGYTTKLVNNLIVGGEITLLAEALGLAKRAGLDLERLKDAISGGAAGSSVLNIKGPKMIRGDFSASSRVLIHLKDQHNAQQLAQSLGASIPACDLSTALLEKLAEMGRGNEDVAAVIDLF